MGRSAPLVPVPILGAAILFVLVLLVATSRPQVRQRWPWLFAELSAFSALTFIHLLFFWQPYRSSALVPRGGGDLVSFFYPIHSFAASEVSAGRLPFWNQHLFSGAPHLANFQTATLSPPNLIAYLLSDPFSYATMERLALVHFLIASVGVYWLARSIGVARPAAVLSGAIFAYSGFMVAHLGHYSMLSTAAWAPWIFAAIVGTVRFGSWASALGGTLVLAIAVLGGHQPILLMTLTAAVAIAVFELWRSLSYPHPSAWTGFRQDWRLIGGVARLVFMAIVALWLTAPALGPSFAMLRYTVRSGLSYEAASEFAVQPVALLHLILPTVFGSNPTDYWGPFSNTEMWGYAGMLAMGLAVFGLLVWPSRTRAFWAVIATVSILFLLGPFASLHGWAYAFVPGYDQMRGAGRAYMFFDLAVALLAGFGLSALIRRREHWFPRQAELAHRAVNVLAVMLVIVVGFVIPLFAAQVLGTNDPGNRPVIALDNVMLLALWLLLGLGVMYAVARGTLAGCALVVAVSVVVLLDIFHATAPFNPTTEPILAGFQHEEAVIFLREQYDEDGPFRIETSTPLWQPNLALVAGLDDIGGLFDPLALAGYQSYLVQARTDRQADAYRNLNVRFIVSDTETESPGAGFSEALTAAGGLIIWEADEWKPRAWIEGSDVELVVTIHEPGRLTVGIPADVGPGMLIVSHVNYPGWTAEVNERRQAITPYNSDLQAIELDQGGMTIEFSFRPERWTLWLAVAAGGGLLWLLTAAVVAVHAIGWLSWRPRR
ncbi:hypothetical protein BH24CHL1_BH24CHL1_01220 [soil metagenome]